MATSTLALSGNPYSPDLRRSRLRATSLPSQAFTKASGPAAPCREYRDSAASARDGDSEKRVLELLPLVRRVALKMRRSLPAQVELDDLVGAGVLGLLDAARKFDERKKVKLESYARHRIRGAILDGLRSLDTASRDLRKKGRKVEETARALQSKLQRPVEDEEMAQALGISLGAWHRSVQELQGAGLNWPQSMQAMSLQPVLEDNLAAPDQKNQFELCYQRERRDIAHRALACLSERERKIIVEYHVREMTMKEIGNQLGIDESRVSQLHSAALDRLRLSVQAILDRTHPMPASRCASLAAGRG